ncbi:MAG: carbonic anhydrase, partial [Planctomycetota bacterium]|nr:carbonic anhydrase [Planctomycetota bacterium]
KELVPAAVEANVWQSIENLLAKSAAIRKRAAEGKLRVEGAVYDLESGRVQWLGAHPRQKQLLEDTDGEERAP